MDVKQFVDGVIANPAAYTRSFLLGAAVLAAVMLLFKVGPRLWRVVEEILEKLGDLNRSGLPIILVEQKAPLALKLARRAYLMSVGSIAAEIDPRHVKSHDELARFYLG